MASCSLRVNRIFMKIKIDLIRKRFDVYINFKVDVPIYGPFTIHKINS